MRFTGGSFEPSRQFFRQFTAKWMFTDTCANRVQRHTLVLVMLGARCIRKGLFRCVVLASEEVELVLCQCAATVHEWIHPST